MRNKLLISFLATILCVQAVAQNTITGKVVETGGQPVVGILIYYEGSDIGTTTNSKGEFSIKAIQGKQLVFSCLGMAEQRITVGGQTTLKVTMVPDDLTLEDAVVIGYGSKQRQDLTGAVASVKADEIRKAGSYDVLGSLQSKVAGLNIANQSGEPGSGYSISIRGNNSINAASTPLVIVDGMQMDIDVDEGATSSMSLSSSDPLAFLNPADIQSVEVLKDASATAIYGARGAGGVILITTKSGYESAGTTSVTLDINLGLNTLARDINMLSGQEWINYRFERHDNEYEYFGKDTDGDGKVDTPKTLADYGRNAVNWRDVMLRNAFTQQYNLSFRSNIGKKTRLLTSLGFQNQPGLIVANEYSKFTAKVKVDHQLARTVTAGVNVNYARTKSTGAATSTGGTFSGYGLTQLIYLEKPVEKFVDPADPSSVYTSQTSIYDCVSDETSRTGIANKLVGNAYLEWAIIPDLKFKVYASGTLSSASNKEFFSEKTRWGHFYNGVATDASSSSGGVTANATLTYKHTWGKKHNFEAILGGELNDYIYESYSQTAVDFEDASLREMALGKGTLWNPVQNKYSNGRLSGFGRVDYNYDYRYYLTMNLRADASSKFASGSRVGFFPSVSFAWRLSNEPWMLEVKHAWMDNFKLRLSAGSSGNDRIANYAYMSTLDKAYYSDGSGKELLAMADYSSGNNNLKWETTWQFNAGLDITLFKGRVDLVFDIYDKETYDMLFLATIPSQTGYTTQWQNIGQVSNRGLEVSLATTNIRNRDFIWKSNFTFATNKNRIESLGEGVTMKPNNISKGSFKEEPTRLMVGQPIGVIWGYEWDGNYQLDDFDIYYQGTKIKVDPSQVSTQNYYDFDYVLKDGVTKMSTVDVMPGDRKLKDQNGDGIIKEADDKKVIGKCDPDFTYGIGNTFTWRGLSLYIFFDGVYGRDILNEFKNNIVPGGTTSYNNISSDAYYNAWRPENGSNLHARLANQINTQSPLSSYFVEDGSYFRLKTINLSYDFPHKWCSAIKMSGIRLSFNVGNVYTWTNYSGMDPDISSTNTTFTGLDRMGYPTGRSYVWGLNLTF